MPEAADDIVSSSHYCLALARWLESLRRNIAPINHERRIFVNIEFEWNFTANWGKVSFIFLLIYEFMLEASSSGSILWDFLGNELAEWWSSVELLISKIANARLSIWLPVCFTLRLVYYIGIIFIRNIRIIGVVRNCKIFFGGSLYVFTRILLVSFIFLDLFKDNFVFKVPWWSLVSW